MSFTTRITYGSPPVPAAAWGLNKRQFRADFNSLGKIDTAKTYAAGFDWYATNWPSIFGIPAGFGVNSYNVSGSILTLGNSGLTPAENTWNSNISTVGYLSGTPPRTVGRSFSAANGLYVESSMRFNLPATNTGEPGWYLMDLTTILSLIDQTTHEGGEIDPIEARSDGIAQTAHRWTNWDTATSEQRPAGGIYSTGIVLAPSQVDTTTFHKYGVLVVPNAMNAGNGFIAWFIDGIQTGGNGPSTSPMTVFEQAEYVIQIVAHPTRTIDIASMEVWSG